MLSVSLIRRQSGSLSSLFEFSKFFDDNLQLLYKCRARVIGVGLVFFGAISGRGIDTFCLLVLMGRVNIRVAFILFGIRGDVLVMFGNEVCRWHRGRLGDDLIVKGLILG